MPAKECKLLLEAWLENASGNEPGGWFSCMMMCNRQTLPQRLVIPTQADTNNSWAGAMAVLECHMCTATGKSVQPQARVYTTQPSHLHPASVRQNMGETYKGEEWGDPQPQ